jgi:hypothetical protein
MSLKPPPRYNPLHSYTTFTMRCSPACASWLLRQSEETEKSSTEILASFLDDLRLWFGLGEAAAEALSAEAKARGLSQRDYILELLVERDASVRKHGANFEKGEPSVLQAKRSSGGMSLEEEPA